MNTYNAFLDSMTSSKSIAVDFATSIGLDSKKLQHVIYDIWAIPNGETDISICVENDASVCLTIYKAKEYSDIDRARFIKMNGDWVELDVKEDLTN